MSLQVLQLRCKRTQALAPCLSDRPQPGGVDVGVSHGHAGRRSLVSILEQRFQFEQVLLRDADPILGKQGASDLPESGIKLVGGRFRGIGGPHQPRREQPGPCEPFREIVPDLEFRRIQSTRSALLPSSVLLAVLPPEE